MSYESVNTPKVTLAMQLKPLVSRYALVTLSTVGAVIGTLLGISLRVQHQKSFSERAIMYTRYLGELYTGMLSAIRVPLLISTIISSVGVLPIRISARMGRTTFFYILGTSLAAMTLSQIATLIIKPGYTYVDHFNIPFQDQFQPNITAVDIMLDILRNLFPSNLIRAWGSHYVTLLKPPEDKNGTVETAPLSEWTVTGRFQDGMNVLGLSVVSIVCGIGLSIDHEEAEHLLKVFHEIAEILLKMAEWVICFSPIGLLSLTLGDMFEIEYLDGVSKMYYLVLTSCLTTIIHSFLILPAIYYYITRKNPYKLIGSILQALATVFAVRSSSLSLPLMIKNLEDYTDIDSRVVRYIVPITTSINKDGTALYEAMATILIAQQRGVQLTLGNHLTIGLTSVAMTISSTFDRHNSLKSLIVITKAIDIPSKYIVLLLPVEWFLIRLRAFVNALSDGFAAGILWHYYKDELRSYDMSGYL